MLNLGLNFLNLDLTKTKVLLNPGLERSVIRAKKYFFSVRLYIFYINLLPEIVEGNLRNTIGNLGSSLPLIIKNKDC